MNHNALNRYNGVVVPVLLPSRKLLNHSNCGFAAVLVTNEISTLYEKDKLVSFLNTVEWNIPYHNSFVYTKEHRGFEATIHYSAAYSIITYSGPPNRQKLYMYMVY